MLFQLLFTLYQDQEGDTTLIFLVQSDWKI